MNKDINVELEIWTATGLLEQSDAYSADVPVSITREYLEGIMAHCQTLLDALPEK